MGGSAADEMIIDDNVEAPPKKFVKGRVGQHNHEAGQRRRQAFLDAHLGKPQGKVADWCAVAGIQVDTYYQWRKTDPEFKARFDKQRLEHQNLAFDVKWTGTFSSFRKDFFGFDTYWHQHQMVEAIESCPPMGVVLILVPPEHGKTTTIADLISQLLAVDPNKRITYVSEGIGHARKSIRRIQRRMTDAPSFGRYVARFGPFYEARNEETGRPWNADFFTVAKADHDEQDYSMEARGWKSAIAGTRTDMLLIDDIQSRKSLGLTDKMVEVFQQDFLTRPGREGKTIIIGTRVGVKDFYESIIDQGLVDRLVCLPATDGSVVPCPMGDKCDVPEVTHEKPLCPELWDIHALAKRRKQVGEDVWWRNYQQKPRAAGDATWTQELIELSKDRLRIVGTKPNHRLRIAGLDPALGGGNAITVCGGDADRLEVVDSFVDYKLTRTEQILQRIEEVARRYAITDLVVEIAAFQRSLANDQRLIDMARRYRFRIHPHSTGFNKIDESLGVASMATSFRYGELTLPWGNPELAERRLHPLVDELLSWRSDVPTRQLRQDLVMSLWFAWLWWMERRRILNVNIEQWNREALPWQGSVHSLVRSR